MNSILISVEFEHVQLRRGQRAVFSQPLAGRLCSGVLNVLSGPNGCGKTSLLDLLTLRTPAPAGAVIRWTGCEDATDIAYLPQQLWDVLDVCIADLIALALGRYPMGTAEAPEALRRVLRKPSRELGTLSGGQRQMLLFWLVSSQPRSCYVYDEPLRHLDPSAGQYVVETIETQVKKGLFVAIAEHSRADPWAVSCEYLVLGPGVVVRK